MRCVVPQASRRRHIGSFNLKSWKAWSPRSSSSVQLTPSRIFCIDWLWSILPLLLGVLAVVIYAVTLLLAAQGSLPALLLTMFLPVTAQAYWIWAVWAATGILFHPLTLLCAAWLTLLGIRIFAQNMFADWRPPHSS
jgi:hypothetical protein